MRHLINNSGFTLIEMITVLSITVTLIFFGITFPLHVINQHKTEQFFEHFQSDLLLMQQETMLTGENIRMTILTDSSVYEIRKGGTGQLMIRRAIPSSWEINFRTLSQPITFMRNGNIKNPGTFSIATDTNTYVITFPFGKARAHIIEQ
jgi:competence protein ComGD